MEDHRKSGESIEQPSEELLQLRRAAQKDNYGYLTVLGFLIAPLFMGFTWLLTGDPEAVGVVGVWIFCSGSAFLALAFTRFLHYSDKLKNVMQQYSVMVRGVLGPFKDNYRTKYDYDRFDASDCKAHRKMHFWGSLAGGAIFAHFSWWGTISFFRQFIWV